MAAPKKEIDIEEIRRMKGEGKTVPQIAAHFKVSPSTIEKRLTPLNRQSKQTSFPTGDNLMSRLGNVSNIDASTALLFINQDKERIQRECDKHEAAAKDYREKFERADRELTDLKAKPSGSMEALSGLAEGFKADPAGVITAVMDGLAKLKNKDAGQSGSHLPAMSVNTDGVHPEAAMVIAAANNMLVNEGRKNPARCIQLVNALAALTQPENASILQQLNPTA